MNLKTDEVNHKTNTGKIGISSLLVLGILIFLISIFILRSIYMPKKELPPDLTGCTRLEIQYDPSPLIELSKFFPAPLKFSLWDNEEIKDINSIKTVSLTDPNCIESFRRKVNKLTIISNRKLSSGDQKKIICYRNDIIITTLILGSLSGMLTEDGIVFETGYWLSFSDYIPELKPYLTRLRCANNQYTLFWDSFKRFVNAKGNYPLSDSWCDELVESFPFVRILSGQIIVQPAKVEYYFICPSAGKGKCHYAMNPNCKPDSPGDMVLLFETKDGWNQNGGPELFTFDNHDPKGGCVLFNDGTVKFIRTEEELNKLRWK